MVFAFAVQARLRLAEEVEKEDVREAMRLMEMSKDSLNHHDQRTTRYHHFSIFLRFQVELIQKLSCILYLICMYFHF